MHFARLVHPELSSIMTLEEGLELIQKYKQGLHKFLDTLPGQAEQLGPEMVKTLTLNSKNEISNLDAIEKALKRPPRYESGLN